MNAPTFATIDEKLVNLDLEIYENKENLSRPEWLKYMANLKDIFKEMEALVALNQTERLHLLLLIYKLCSIIQDNIGAMNFNPRLTNV